MCDAMMSAAHVLITIYPFNAIDILF